MTGNGGAIASLANTTLSTTVSTFKGNSAHGDGGAVYLGASNATLNGNAAAENHAASGESTYGIDSIVNGSAISPFLR